MLNFCFFVSACQAYGFIIDHDVPWRVFADLESPFLQKYIMDYNPEFTSEEEEDLDELSTDEAGRADSPSPARVGDGSLLSQLQNKYYIPAHYEGYANFRNFAFAAYNAFVSQNRIVRAKFECVSGDRIRQRVMRRNLLKPSLVTNYNNGDKATGTYDEQYWMEKYIYFRNIEENNILSEAALNKVTIDAKNMLQSRPIDVTLDYVEIKYADTHKDPGSFFERKARESAANRGGTYVGHVNGINISIGSEFEGSTGGYADRKTTTPTSEYADDSTSGTENEY